MTCTDPSGCFKTFCVHDQLLAVPSTSQEPTASQAVTQTFSEVIKPTLADDLSARNSRQRNSVERSDCWAGVGCLCGMSVAEQAWWPDARACTRAINSCYQHW